MKFLKLFYCFIFFIICSNCNNFLFWNKKNIVAKVNNYYITKDYLLLKAKLYDIDIKTYQEYYNFLNFLINNILIYQQAQKDKIKLNKEELEKEINNFIPGFSKKEIKNMLKKTNIKYSDWIKDLEEKLIIKKEINYITEKNIKIKEEELRDYFWTNIVKYRKLKKVKASQIVVDTIEKAEEILIKLKNNEDFNKLAKKYSVTSGEELGYFGEKDMPDFIVNTVFKLKKGEISGIIKSDYGYHIFKCEDIIESQTPDFEEVREDVYKDLLEEKKDNFFNTMMKNLRKNAKIIIYTENLKSIIDEKEE